MKLLFNDEIPDRAKKKKVYKKKEKVVVDEPYIGNVSDVSYIREAVYKALFRDPDNEIKVKEVIKPSDYAEGMRPLSYRVTVHSRTSRRAIHSFWVEKVEDGYVFSPPLNYKDIEDASRSKFDKEKGINPSGISIRK